MSGFPDSSRILKLQETEHEVVTKYVISKCNISFQIFVQKDFQKVSDSTGNPDSFGKSEHFAEPF